MSRSESSKTKRKKPEQLDNLDGRRQSTENQKKSCKQCPLCAKQNIVSRLRRFQVNWDDYVTLCDNEQCLYPLVSSTVETPVPPTGQSSLISGARATEVPTVDNSNFFIQDFARQTDFFTAPDDISVIVPRHEEIQEPRVTDTLENFDSAAMDASDILHNIMFFGNDKGSSADVEAIEDANRFRSEDIDTLVDMLNAVTSDEVTSNRHTSSIPRMHNRLQATQGDNDDDDWSHLLQTDNDDSSSTITELDSRISTPDRLCQVARLAEKKTFPNLFERQTTVCPNKATIERTSSRATASSEANDAGALRTNECDRAALSIATTNVKKTNCKKSTTALSASNKLPPKRVSASSSMKSLNFMNLFSEKARQRKRSSTSSRASNSSASVSSSSAAARVVAERRIVPASSNVVSDGGIGINKNKMVSSWLDGRTSVGVSKNNKKNTFAGFQSYTGRVAVQSAAAAAAAATDGSPSEDSGIQSPLSLRSAGSDSTAVR